jgi:hypothetical protein
MPENFQLNTEYSNSPDLIDGTKTENISDQNNSGLPLKTKNIVTVVSLILIFPIGVIFMWAWTSWKKWIKLAITFVGCFPLVIGITFLILSSFIMKDNTSSSIDNDGCVTQCKQYAPGSQECIDQCIKSMSKETK